MPDGSEIDSNLAKHSIGFIQAIKGLVDEKKVKDAVKESSKHASDAFYECLPKSIGIDHDVFSKFLKSQAFEFQCEKILNGQDYELDILEETFRELTYGKINVDKFDLRRAISVFIDEFIASMVEKEGFVELEEQNLSKIAFRRRYLQQLVHSYETLGFSAMACRFEQEPIKLEDIFIEFETFRDSPEADIPIEELEKLEELERQGADKQNIAQKLAQRPIRKQTDILSATKALGESNNLVVLGAPGSGKTTFMKYLAITFAQKKSKDNLQISEDRLPILVIIRDIVPELSSGKTIAEVLAKHINSQLEFNLPEDYFIPYLESGKCIVLFDGLDEVADKNIREKVANSISLFANLYKGNRYVITSRIAGYREIKQLPKNEFEHFTIREFDDDKIKSFISKWYKARCKTKEEADKNTSDLINALNRSQKVRQLATNPLMLTIIAIVHRSDAELPNQRIILYDRCTEALIYSWQKHHSRQPFKDIFGNVVPDSDIRENLEKIAYWMHSEHPDNIHVEFNELKQKLAETIIEKKKYSLLQAEEEAKSFLIYVRETTGVLLERGTELYAFMHFTFQEYFTACDIYHRNGTDINAIWKEIKPNLHNSHWREVILLLSAKLNEFRGAGQKIVDKILKANTPYNETLQCDLLLAGACLADDVTVDAETSKKILDEIVNLAVNSSYGTQKNYSTDVLREVMSSHYKDYLNAKFLSLLDDKDSDVRRSVVIALGNIGKADERVIDKLLPLLDDKEVRSDVVEALGNIGKVDDRVIDKLLPLLDDRKWEVRSYVASTLGKIGNVDERVVDKLLVMLNNRNNDLRLNVAIALGNISKVNNKVIDKLLTMLYDSIGCRHVASALGNIGKTDERVIDKLLPLLDDRDSSVFYVVSALGNIGKADDRIIDKLLLLLDDGEMHCSVTFALGKIGKADDRVIDKLLSLLDDEDRYVRHNVVFALGNIGKADDRIIDRLLPLLDNSMVEMRNYVASTLGDIGKADDRIIDKLLPLLDDKDSYVRGSVAYALGKIGKADDRVIDKLLSLLKDSYVRRSVAYALGNIGKADERIIDKLLPLLDDKDSGVRRYVAEALGNIGKEKRVVDKLLPLLDDKDSDVRSYVAYALVQMGVMKDDIINALDTISKTRSSEYIPGSGMKFHDWAFQMLWKYAPSVAESSETQK